MSTPLPVEKYDTHNTARTHRVVPRVTFSAPGFDWLAVIFFQRWRWMLLSTLVASLSVLIALPFLTRQYEITAALLFKAGREQAPPALSGVETVTPTFRRSEDVISEAKMISSQALVESLVEAFGADYFLARKPPETLWDQVKYAARSVVLWLREMIQEAMILAGLERRLTPFEKVTSLLQQSLQAEAVKRADVVEITLQFPDQKAGIEVMNKLIELYLAEHIRAFKTPGATAFLVARVETLKAELSALEAQRREFNQGAALWDLEDQRKSLLLQQRELRQALSRSVEDASRVAAEIQQAEGLLASAPPESRVTRVEQSNPVVTALQARIADQRARLERLRLVYGADSRRIEDEAAEIVQLEKLLASQSKSVMQSETFEVSSGYRDAERGLAERRNRQAGMRAQEARLREQDRLLGNALAQLDGLGEQDRRLRRDITLAEQNYQLYARRLEEARISDALDDAEISNVSVIGRPTASVSPTRPRSMLLFYGALAAGLLGSFGFFVIRDVLRPTVHSRDQASAALGAPALGRLPEVRP